MTVVAAVVVLVIVLTSGPDTSTADGAAKAAVTAFADKDTKALTALLCSGASNPLDQVAPSPLVGAELGAVRPDGADNAVAEVSVTYADSTEPTEMGLARENGRWCLAWFGN
ncbi:hypothetical protein ACFFQW_26500 [Umezawaea endophytica]|uniref:Uncharacterized protein n=1 Tax=Umezawaea endophytica TaxID=1654476 RepID=A0A9X2VM19_9PSEU|nr:hypothetical protein [Umezawaea endophytica]MCS7477668.1 hypothetical protein [Umezawaea endophytica]